MLCLTLALCMWEEASCSHWRSLLWKTCEAQSVNENQSRAVSVQTAWFRQHKHYRGTFMLWSGKVQLRVVFVNIFCECGVNMFLHCLMKTACVLLLQCGRSVLPLLCVTVSHPCHSSSLNVTVKLRLVEKTTNSCLTVKTSQHPSFVLHHLCVDRMCTLQIQSQTSWQWSFPQFSLTLDCFHTRVNLL